ncbi:MAG: pilus assembly protein [Burkholderiaceae bacterium]
MTHTKKTDLLATFRLAGIGLALAAVTAPALSAPAQAPLLSRDGYEGKPNLMFTLDDSGSMDWQFMPDSVYNNNWPGSGVYNTGFDPSESAQIPFARNRFISTDTGDRIVTSWRSNQVNKVYYNPNIQYLPWVESDGTPFPDSPPTAAVVTPQAATPTTVDLTTSGAVTAWWCDSGGCANQTIDYAPATYFQYNGGDETDPNNYTRVRIVDSASYTRPATRAECAVDLLDPNVRICTQQQELQNFANWFTYYRRRMSLAIGATSQAFAGQGAGLRIGYGRINNYGTSVDGQNHGAVVRGVRDFDGQDRQDFFDWLHASIGNGGTPLRYAMDQVGRYFERTDNAGPWAEVPGGNDSSDHLQCRKSYHILMSDGYWNGTQASTVAARANVDNTTGPLITGGGGVSFQYVPSTPYRDDTSNTLADVAMYYWNRDLRPDLDNLVRPDQNNPAFWQQLVQYTVGLGVGGALDPETDLQDLIDGNLQWTSVFTLEGLVDDLWHAAVNSHGRYLSASDPVQFATALGEVLQDIDERESAEGGVAVSSFTLETRARKFIPTYKTATWSGDVNAKQLDERGVAIADLWVASDNVPAAAARNIFVGRGNNNGATPFLWNQIPADVKVDMGPNANENLVNYLRGDRSLEGTTYRERDPKSILGDMVNSTPTLVGSLVDEDYEYLPSSIPGAGSYRQFVADKKARDQVLFVGSNDGMLHGFRASDGVESFAFIPRAALPDLYKYAQPAYQHQFYVDGPITEADYYDGGWNNMLVGSLGGGGRSLYAINTTNTASFDASNVMWEFDHPEMGYIMAPISTGVTQSGQWVAIFGNGFESDSQRARLFIVDLTNGSVIRTIPVGTAGNNGLGGARLIKDLNNVIVGVYAGDLQGNLWRFDMLSTSPGNWDVGFDNNPLYTAKDSNGIAQPITAAPEYLAHPEKGQLVVFGTGRLFADSDLQQTTDQTLYGIWDKVEFNSATSAATRFQPGDTLVARQFGPMVTSGGSEYFGVQDVDPIDWSVHRGWTLPLTLEAGQRSIYTPQLIRGFVLFSTVAPTGGTGLPCDDSRSTGYNILLNALTGSAPAKPILDTNSDGVIDENDTNESVYKTIADGSDKILLGKEGKVVIARTDAETSALIEGRGLERTWRQILNFPRN